MIELIAEMNNFEPSKLTDREIKHSNQHKDNLKARNPELRDQEIENAVFITPERLFYVRYSTRLANHASKIILLSSAVVEAAVNLYIALKIDAADDHELFVDIEKMGVCS